MNRRAGSAGTNGYRIRVTKDYLVFCAGHFITYRGHQCECLHGHNYRVGVTLAGALEEDGYVMDFTVVKRSLRKIVDELDHKMLLARDNPVVRVAESDGHTTATYRERRYAFPSQDVVVLPIPNTTAEMLARYLMRRLAEELPTPDGRIDWMEMEVEESFGQSAVCREPFATLRQERLTQPAAASRPRFSAARCPRLR